MKKIIPIFALMIPAWLYSCTGTKPPVPTPASVIEQAHEAFPFPTMPKAPVVIPTKPKAPAVKHTPVRKPQVPQVKRKPLVAPVAPPEQLPPQQGPICIFPLNMIPNCTPEPSGRMP